MSDRMVVLKLDGEIWECLPGFDTDENSIGGVQEIKPSSKAMSDRNALARGITHRQSMLGVTKVPCHEVRKLGVVGDGQDFSANRKSAHSISAGCRGVTIGVGENEGRKEVFLRFETSMGLLQFFSSPEDMENMALKILEAVTMCRDSN